MQSLAKGEAYLDLVPTSIEKAQSGTPLSVIRRDNKQVLEACLLVVIADCCDYYGVEWKSHVQVKLIDKILSSYYYLRFEEIVMIIQQGVEGERDSGMQNLKPNHILAWIGDYDEERTEYYISENLKHKESYEKQFDEMEIKDKKKESKKLRDEIERQSNYSKAKEIVNDRLSKSHQAKEAQKALSK